eukprot:GHRQ01024736.1.p1 GENE.GHRQ01024736.1~~GHRQ01024736.1.p1  ORF type:complete len:109 (-),score=29.36 GHRQ01024736.1:265-591(-)
MHRHADYSHHSRAVVCVFTSCSSAVVITASAVNRATKRVDLKAIVDDGIGKAAANGYRGVQKVLVYEKSALPRYAAARCLPASSGCLERLQQLLLNQSQPCALSSSGL